MSSTLEQIVLGVGAAIIGVAVGVLVGAAAGAAVKTHLQLGEHTMTTGKFVVEPGSIIVMGGEPVELTVEGSTQPVRFMKIVYQEYGKDGKHTIYIPGEFMAVCMSYGSACAKMMNGTTGKGTTGPNVN